MDTARTPAAALPKIIFFDIDDTLYFTADQRVPDSTRRALHLLRRRGIECAIATGRAPAVLPQEIRTLMAECGMNTLVAVNGQYVCFRGEQLDGFALTAKDVADTAALLDALDIAYVCVGRQGFWLSRASGEVREALSAVHIACDGWPAGGRPNTDDAVYQMLAFYPQEREAEVAGGLSGRLKTVRWHRCGVDILDRDGSKARGIAAVLAHYGWNMADAAAFGDGLNDREMLQTVGFGVAMGNAVDALKEVADHIAPPVWDNGLYRALLELGWIEAEEEAV